ncbi:hypothetical protein [Nocardiopsis halophila]|uniref:hypothetical protein n=1 Tax=Nocardiopsis halophila TaxID=141692 RepID=UPI00139F2A33|nr:hypothetical protein [Nocardiopsis halophila]
MPHLAPLADHPSLSRVPAQGPITDPQELTGDEDLTADKLGPGSEVVRSPRPRY